MNKAELVEYVAFEANLSKTEAARALDAMIQGVTNTLGAGGTVALTGFGAFSVAKRSARVARNPQTGESLPVAATVAPKFKPGSGLKAAVRAL